MLQFYQITDANLLLVVLLEDPPTHTNEHPFCADDPDCPCRSDSNLVREFIDKPIDNGLLTGSEAIRLYFGRNV
jgi:hypothetical protein